MPPADKAAERAILTLLIHYPHTAPEITPHVSADDFYWPDHAQLWTHWHNAHQTTGTPPDGITLLNHLTTRDPRGDLRRLLGDLITNEHAVAPLAEQYATIVRDKARLRAFTEASARLNQLAYTGDLDGIERTIGDLYQVFDDVVTRYGPTATHANTTGLADLTWVDGGRPPHVPPPTWTHRTDGVPLFYAARVNGIFGDPAAAKTWLAQTAMIEALNTGGTAAMIDVDHNGADHTAARLLLLGARPADIANPDRLRYYEPEDADQLRAAVTDITRLAPDVVVIDSLGEIFPMLGVSTNDGDEMTTALRQVCTPPATAGSCVITIDHLPKSTETRATGYAIGSIAKKRMIRGSYIRAETVNQPAPGRVGRVTLRLEKDTSGALERHCPGRLIGSFILDSTRALNEPNTGAEQQFTSWSIELETAPIATDGTFRPTAAMEAVSRYVEDNDQAGVREITRGVRARDKGFKSTTIATALELLISEGYMVRIAGANNKQMHHSISHYREADDANPE